LNIWDISSAFILSLSSMLGTKSDSEKDKPIISTRMMNKMLEYRGWFKSNGIDAGFYF
jgi:hypothetical protein